MGSLARLRIRKPSPDRLRLRPEPAGLRAAATRTFGAILWIGLPIAVPVAYFSSAYNSVGPVPDGSLERVWGFDFRALWLAAGDVLAGASPYPAATVSALNGEDQFVYPPSAALIAAPFRMLSFEAAATLMAVALGLSTLLVLWVVGVRDWRCYGLPFLWVAVLGGIHLGAISILLALGAALAWRFRDSWLGAAAVAFLLATKIFLWPLLIWLIATRRVGKAVGAILAGVAAVAMSWALIGFEGLREYPGLLSTLSDVVAWKSYSLQAFALSLGATDLGAQLVVFACGAAVLAAVFVMGRRGGESHDRLAFIAAIAAAFALSPIVWIHYFALLLVPIAVARPRFSPLWLVPCALVLTPHQSGGEFWRIALALAVAATVFVASAIEPRPLPSLFVRRKLALQPLAKL